MKSYSEPLSSTENISWDVVQENMSHVQEISEGFSSAFKGILRLDSGQEIFVKLASDDARSENFIDHEIAAYDLLSQHNYGYAPQLLSVAPDKKGFALEVLGPDDGWSWPKQWTEVCLQGVLRAMDSLCEIDPINDQGEPFLSSRPLDENKNGWAILGDSPEMQATLAKRLHGRIPDELVIDQDFIEEMVRREAAFRFKKDTLVHNDIRSYNCAWHEQKGAKLIDFDSLGLGDARIAYAFTLGDAYGDGVDIASYCSKTDMESLEWVAGYWLAESFRENLDPEDRENKIRRGAAILRFCRDVR